VGKFIPQIANCGALNSHFVPITYWPFYWLSKHVFVGFAARLKFHKNRTRDSPADIAFLPRDAMHKFGLCRHAAGADWPTGMGGFSAGPYFRKFTGAPAVHRCTVVRTTRIYFIDNQLRQSADCRRCSIPTSWEAYRASPEP